MRPVGHLIAGGVFAGVGELFFNHQVAAGAFLGSIILDLDHVIIMKEAGIKPQTLIKALASPKKIREMLKKISDTIEMLYRQYDTKPWLDIAFLHTAEVLLPILFLSAMLDSGFLWAMWGAMIFHIALDYYDVFTHNRKSLGLRCWSIIQYFIMKKHTPTYPDAWPRT